MELSTAEKKSLLARLKRAEGQVAAVRRMVDSEAGCVDVLTQLAAARGALGRVGEVVLRNHVETCVTKALASDDAVAKETEIDQLMGVFGRYAGFGG